MNDLRKSSNAIFPHPFSSTSRLRDCQIGFAYGKSGNRQLWRPPGCVLTNVWSLDSRQPEKHLRAETTLDIADMNYARDAVADGQVDQTSGFCRHPTLRFGQKCAGGRPVLKKWNPGVWLTTGSIFFSFQYHGVLTEDALTSTQLYTIFEA